MKPNEFINYRTPDLKPLVRQYVVKGEDGRLGIAIAQAGRPDVLFVRPAGCPAVINAPAEMGLAPNAVIITETAFHQSGPVWSGVWFDSNQVVNLTIVDDLGILMPDNIADLFANSGEIGWWDTHELRVVPTGRQRGYMTVPEAVEYAHQTGVDLSEVGVRKAARTGNIPGARRVGRDWLIPYDGFNQYLDNRPQRGRPRKNGTN